MQFIIPYDQIGLTNPGPWQNAAPSSGVQGSIPNADFFPAVQNEILNAIEAAGITPSATDFTQLSQAIPKLAGGVVHIGSDTSGAANTIIAAVSPAITSYVEGHVYFVQVAHNCAGPNTAAFNGLASKPVVHNDSGALVSGDYNVQEILALVDDGTHFRMVRLTNSQIEALIIGAIPSIIAADPSIGPARNLIAEVTAETYSFTVPAGVNWLYVTVVGAGGGGAGGGAGSSWSGGGGASGGTAQAWVAVTPGQVITYIVGAGGAGSGQGNGVQGAAGGTSSFGALGATGGTGGQAGTATCAGGAPGVGSGGQVNLLGSAGGDGNSFTQNTQGGQGGASSLGGGGRTSTLQGATCNAVAPGSGGGGIWQSGGAAQTGGHGADGAVFISY